MSVEPDICQECGAVIEQAIVTIPGPFGMPMDCRQALCLTCAFAEHTRISTTCRRPYKTPRTRYRPDGGVPASFVERFNQEKSRFI